ncbi:hypothetical protein [Nocardioides sp. LHG3406-4]|uniref:hypothetical protein n=1 Tax=Nocardioides sp. LHG3406-4 TaxID=2804575 RepID=UPI003CFACE93
MWSDSLPVDLYGHTDYAKRLITLRTGMSFEERRCTITHEVEHVLRGPVSRCRELREEYAVDLRCGRLLLPSVRTLADSLIWHHGDLEAVSEEMWVDPWTLESRLGSLRPLERGYLHRRLADVELLTVDH